jgi:hypothetical protein
MSARGEMADIVGTALECRFLIKADIELADIVEGCRVSTIDPNIEINVRDVEPTSFTSGDGGAAGVGFGTEPHLEIKK